MVVGWSCKFVEERKEARGLVGMKWEVVCV